MAEKWDKYTEEWLKQAEYDLDTARYLFQGRRYIYAIFMAHLALEKTLKGLITKTKKTVPPKSHNLIFLLKNTGIEMDRDDENNAHYLFLSRINELSIPTRYPHNLSEFQKTFDEKRTREMLEKSQEVFDWLISLR